MTEVVLATLYALIVMLFCLQLKPVTFWKVKHIFLICPSHCRQ